MGQPSFQNDMKWRVERIEAELQEIRRARPRRPPNLRDLQDINGWGAADGHSVFYDTEYGRYKVALAPPTLKFNQHGAVTVESSDHDPMGGAGKLILVKARLAVAGSSTTTALLKEGSTTVATVSFTSGNVLPSVTPSTIAHSYAADDYWWLDITAAGTGAEGLVVSGWATAA